MTGNKPDLVARAKRFLEKPENKPNCEECIEKYGLDKKVLWHCPEGKTPETCEKANRKPEGTLSQSSSAGEVSPRKPKSCTECKHYEQDCEGEDPNTDCDQWNEPMAEM